MAVSIREAIKRCHGKSGVLSLERDLFGKYGKYGTRLTPPSRSVLARIDLMQHSPFIRVAFVDLLPNIDIRQIMQRDLDDANELFQTRCGAWIYATGSISVQTSLLGANGLIDQHDCFPTGHVVSDEEDALFDLGRDLEADIVCYYIAGSPVAMITGCAAHPDGRPGFWVQSNVLGSNYAFAHELGHVLGLGHVDDSQNLMDITTPVFTHSTPPQLTGFQCWRMFGQGTFDRPYVERCG